MGKDRSEGIGVRNWEWECMIRAMRTPEKQKYSNWDIRKGREKKVYYGMGKLKTQSNVRISGTDHDKA